MSTEPYEPLAPTTLLVDSITKLGHALALQSSTDPDQQSWKTELLISGVRHPDPFIRAKIARSCSLAQLRLLMNDDHVAVRSMCTENPFMVEEELQLIVAHDDDAVVVHALLDNVQVYRSAVEVLIGSRHFSVRFRLARSRLAFDLLEGLMMDSHPRVADMARRNIRYLTVGKIGGSM